jgi:hypothetical protein
MSFYYKVLHSLRTTRKHRTLKMNKQTRENEIHTAGWVVIAIVIFVLIGLYFGDERAKIASAFNTAAAAEHEKSQVIVHPAITAIDAKAADSLLVTLLKTDPMRGLQELKEMMKNIDDPVHLEMMKEQLVNWDMGFAKVTVRPTNFDSLTMSISTSEDGKRMTVSTIRMANIGRLQPQFGVPDDKMGGMTTLVILEANGEITGSLDWGPGAIDKPEHDAQKACEVLADHVAIIEAFMSYAVTQSLRKSEVAKAEQTMRRLDTDRWKIAMIQKAAEEAKNQK